jgi:Asp-tRNA(Asn)/Glu-tRNA(Gln) amidotransferase A subunit family amidase
MGEEGLDAWISPSATGPAPRGLGSTGNPAMNIPWTCSGVPTISLPAGAGPAGLPVGVQLAGRFNRDEDLLAAARRLAPALGGAAHPPE